MLIAIDFDNTFSRDPLLFAKQIYNYHQNGDKCIIVTGRSNENPWRNEIEKTVKQFCDIPIVFAGKLWKRKAAELAGYNVDIWIDDLPEYISNQDPEKIKYKTNEIEFWQQLNVIGAGITIEAEDLDDFFPCHACNEKWKYKDKVTFVRDKDKLITYTVHDSCWNKLLVKIFLL